MTTPIAYLNTLIMLSLGLLHFYWAASGQWGLAKAVPTDASGRRVLQTSRLSCIVVGSGLLGFALYYFSLTGRVAIQWPFGLRQWGTWALAAIFTLRAIGDFRYVGFFKKLKNTDFAKSDTNFYAPLCLYLGLSSAWIAF